MDRVGTVRGDPGDLQGAPGDHASSVLLTPEQVHLISPLINPPHPTSTHPTPQHPPTQHQSLASLLGEDCRSLATTPAQVVAFRNFTDPQT